MDRFLLTVCLGIGLAALAQGLCNPGYTDAQCNNGRNSGGTFKKGLINALLQRRNLDLAELDDETLKRALALLLEEERNGDGNQDFMLEEEKNLSPAREFDEADEKRMSRYEELREMLEKILNE